MAAAKKAATSAAKQVAANKAVQRGKAAKATATNAAVVKKQTPKGRKDCC